MRRQLRLGTSLAILTVTHVVATYAAFAVAIALAWVRVPGFDVVNEPAYEILALAPVSHPVIFAAAASDPRVSAADTALLGLGYLLPALGIGWFLYRRLPLVRDAGVCSNCGYDVRVTPDRCPECGTVLREPAAA